MARIYKGTETNLKLFIPCNYDYTDLDVVLFTDNPNKSIIITEVERNEDIINVRVKKDDLSILNDGVVKYIITDADGISIERQSNYYLKTPSSYEAENVTTQLLKEVVFVENGEYSVKVDDGYIGMEEVKVNIDLPIEEIRETSYSEGKEIGVQEGYASGYTQGSSDGYSSGYTVGNTEGYSSGYTVGNTEGFENGHTQGYSEGYIEGTEIGYNAGKSDQKELLEPIIITENGTYSREDGYSEVTVNVPDTNGSYDEGYSDGINEAGSVIAETAQVLNITENGNYLTQYSDPIIPEIVTGIYPDGTGFYSYTTLTDAVYDTDILPTENTKVELWIKPKYKSTTNNLYILGVQNGVIAKSVFKISVVNNTIETEIGGSLIKFDLEDKWYHIEMSYANGLIVDGEKKGDYTQNLTNNYGNSFTINSLNSFGPISKQNGTYGMIKITNDGEETIIIPIADGFLNTNTNELLTKVQDGYYNYVENTIVYGEGNLVKTINVDLVPKINVWENNIKFGESSFDNLPKELDFRGQPVNLEGMFRNCKNLRDLPFIDTSKVVNYSEWLYNTFGLLTLPFEIVLHKDASCYKMFYYSRLKEIPYLDTSNVTNIHYMFGYNNNITTLPPFDFSKVKNCQYWIEGCTNLESLPYYDFTNVTEGLNYFIGFGGNLTKLTEIGGFAFKQSCTGNYGFKKIPNLSYQSCINQLNALYDFVGNNEQPTSSQGQLTVHQSFVDLVGDEITIATNKGWTITT